MNQKKLPEAWYLEEGDKIEINSKTFQILNV